MPITVNCFDDDDAFFDFFFGNVDLLFGRGGFLFLWSVVTACVVLFDNSCCCSSPLPSPLCNARVRLCLLLSTTCTFLVLSTIITSVRSFNRFDCRTAACCCCCCCSAVIVLVALVFIVCVRRRSAAFSSSSFCIATTLEEGLRNRNDLRDAVLLPLFTVLLSAMFYCC